MELEQLLEPKAVQKAFRTSLSYVYKLAEEGRIPCVRIPHEGVGSRKRAMLRFRPSDVQEFIEKNYSRGGQRK